MLISKVAAIRIPIPHEQGEWMEFAPLSWSMKRVAIETAQMNSVQRVKGMFEGFSEAAMKAFGGRTIPDDAKQSDELDQHYTLSRCITAWSYPDEVTLENIGDLDAETADWAFQEALKLCGRKDEEGEGFAAA